MKKLLSLILLVMFLMPIVSHAESSIRVLVTIRDDSDSASQFKSLIMERLTDMKDISVMNDPKTQTEDMELKMVLLEQKNDNGDIIGFTLSIDTYKNCKFNILEIMTADNIDRLGNMVLDYLKTKIFKPYLDNKLWIDPSLKPKPADDNDINP